MWTPNTLKALTKITKTSTSENSDPHSKNLKDLLKAILDTNEKSFLLLQYWVQHLKTENYRCDIAALVAESEKMLT